MQYAPVSCWGSGTPVGVAVADTILAQLHEKQLGCIMGSIWERRICLRFEEGGGLLVLYFQDFEQDS